MSTSIVRVKKTYYSDKRNGLHIKLSITPLMKLSRGGHLLVEDIRTVGAEEVGKNIVDLIETPISLIKDGIYEIVPCNPVKDWETGHIEDYEYRLKPVRTNNE